MAGTFGAFFLILDQYEDLFFFLNTIIFRCDNGVVKCYYKLCDVFKVGNSNQKRKIDVYTTKIVHSVLLT